MIIVIDFRKAYYTDKALRVFTIEFWQEMARDQGGHSFIFLVDGAELPQPAEKNVTIKKMSRLPLKWLEKKRLDSFLAAGQADWLITAEETGYRITGLDPHGKKSPAGKSIQQIWFAGSSRATHLKKTLPPAVMKTVRPACHTVITGLTWAEAESVKTQYAGGRSFFLFAGNISAQHQLVGLLKAFSIFKKWQLSNMQLLIAGYTTDFTDVLEAQLQQYKYRADVVIVKNPSRLEMARLIAASYALLYPVADHVFPIGLIWGVQSNKAVIALDKGPVRQLTNAAEWVSEPFTPEAFAKAMILLYKNENHLLRLVQQTTEKENRLIRSQVLAEVWACIE